MAIFLPAVEYVLSKEGGLEDNRKDPGGITNFGISLRFLRNLSKEKLREYGIFEEANDSTIKEMTKDLAIKIYKGEYWSATFEKIIDQNLCDYLFSASVNSGIGMAVKCLQRAIWSIYENPGLVAEDGVLGDKTLLIINSVTLDIRQRLFAALRSERAGDYRVICATNPDQKEFLQGWLNRAYTI
jgi:lysozyme family protein